MHTEMTGKDLEYQLAMAGWSFGSGIDKNTGVSWYAYHRLIGGANCACNDKPPSLIIKPYDTTFGNQGPFRSVQFEIRGELANGHWVEFSVYGVKYEEVMSDMERCTKVLLTAWNAVAGL
jgi:hypothetical protein